MAMPALDVYIVEDSVLLQQRLGEALTELAGARVVGHAGTAADAIRGITEGRPALVTVDLWLDAGNGFQVMKWLQDRPGVERPSYVVLSSHIDSVHTVEALRHGAAAVFDKARDLMHLVAFVRHLAKTRQATSLAIAPSHDPRPRPPAAPPPDD